MLQLLSPERVAIAPANPDQYVEASRTEIAPQMPSPTQDLLQSIRIGLRDVAGETAQSIRCLSEATVGQALEIGQQLWRMQKDLKRKEYSTFLSVLGWASVKARKFINLAKTFSEFQPSQLVGIEITTLLSLCSKRYAAVVEQLREIENITQQLVEQLLAEARSPRKPKLEPISGWKRNPSGGGRHYSIILNDEDTGVSIEQQAQASQVLPHRVIAEGVALRALQKSGAVLVSDYRLAQLEELPRVVDNARELERKNRSLELELSGAKREISSRDRLIDSLKLQMTERASVPTELSASGLPGLDAAQESYNHAKNERQPYTPLLSVETKLRRIEAVARFEEVFPSSKTTQWSAEQEETEVTQATDYLESALEDDLLASVPLKEPVEEAATITIPQDAVASELMEEFLATIVPQSPEAEPVSDGSTTTVPNAVASEPAEPASQPSASDGASTALQPLVVDWEVLKQLRDAEGSLRKIDTLIQDLNSRLAQSGSNVVERELRPVLKKQQHLRSTTVDQIVALIDSNVIPAYYEELQNKGRVVLDPKYASDILVQAQSWSDVVMIVGGNAKQLLAAVKPWSFDEKQHLVRLLSTYLETEPLALEHIDWIPKNLLEKSLSTLSFKIRKIGGASNLVDEPKIEYIPCDFVSLEYPGTRSEQWIFRGSDNKLYPVFGRDEIEVERF